MDKEEGGSCLRACGVESSQDQGGELRHECLVQRDGGKVEEIIVFEPSVGLFNGNAWQWRSGSHNVVNASTEGPLCKVCGTCGGLAACEALLIANTLVGNSMAQQLQACNQVSTAAVGEIMAKGFHGHLVKKKRYRATACLPRLDAVGTSVDAAPALEQEKVSDDVSTSSLGNTVWISKLQTPVMHHSPAEAVAHGLGCRPGATPCSNPQGGMDDSLSLIGLDREHDPVECRGRLPDRGANESVVGGNCCPVCFVTKPDCVCLMAQLQ
jgi:hypothetical protein